ncbi:MAG: TonB-dependent receptor [Flavobacteriaceae bacterium]|nr:TonB-dependent receptor [Flavobacteriaceae bacterium]MDH3795265.1 TonB-dependent receptor [Flavobacteriaceae bacterium]
MKDLFCLLLVGLTASMCLSQEISKDSVLAKEVVLDEVFLTAIRATSTMPVTFSNLQKEALDKRNLGQDIPILLNYLPGVVSTSDAGAGIGYTGIRVRGSDATRVNVTINGIPYNDAESQGTFWVNMPDFASSTQSIQLQRGVGTSTNGAGAFGASLNVLTDAYSDEAYGQIATGWGSFNSMRHNVKFSTGSLGSGFEIAGRLSRITSDGYIDRASSELDSYFLQAAFKDDNTLVKVLLFGGHEITYQSWFGIDAATLETDRTFNPAGIYTDDNGQLQFYDNEVDNYKQDHFQLLFNQGLGSNWNTNIGLHYTRGRGYFEQFREDDSFKTYGLAPITVNGEEVITTDLVRRRWLDNDFYGATLTVNHKKEALDIVFGAAHNWYAGDHFGEVVWARYASDSFIRDRYYDDNSNKTDANIFGKIQYQASSHWNLFADVQWRGVSYQANGADTGIVDDTFSFFNPKAGVSYVLNAHQNVYLSYAKAHREPNRNDYENGMPRPEKLDDIELGWRYYKNKTLLNANLYYMAYKDQLVLTGALNDVGAPLRANVGDSYRFGLELDGRFEIGKKLIWQPNLSLSVNRNRDFFFERDGNLQALGNTHISYSPGIVAGNAIQYSPTEQWQFALLTKYVGEQYMGNIDSENSLLEAYLYSDLNIQFVWETKGWVDHVIVSALINNIFDATYESNGYFFTYDDDFSVPGVLTTIEGSGYYPQAGINALLGVTVKF